MATEPKKNIPQSQGKISQTGNMKSLIWDDIPNQGYYLLWSNDGHLISNNAVYKTRDVSPVDYRPSTGQPHHFVREKKMQYLTPDTWHVTPDSWNLTPDMWQVVGG